jgi:hypothetical protein
MDARDLVDNALAAVRALVRNHTPMSRYAVDLLLADFERDLWRAVKGLEDAVERGVAAEIDGLERHVDCLEAELALVKAKRRRAGTAASNKEKGNGHRVEQQ